MSNTNSIFKPIFFIMALGVVLGTILGLVNSASKHQIEINYNFEVQKCILYTVGIDTENQSKEETFNTFNNYLKENKLRGIKYYSYYENSSLEGYSFPFSANGLWGSISGYLAIDKDANQLLGIVFTAHDETPGLGARIDELWFKEQFRGLDISKEKNHIYFGIDVDGALDTISGATMTVDAITVILNESIDELKKIIKEELNE